MNDRESHIGLGAVLFIVAALGFILWTTHAHGAEPTLDTIRWEHGITPHGTPYNVQYSPGVLVQSLTGQFWAEATALKWPEGQECGDAAKVAGKCSSTIVVDDKLPIVVMNRLRIIDHEGAHLDGCEHTATPHPRDVPKWDTEECKLQAEGKL